jgi:hypothetical protein
LQLRRREFIKAMIAVGLVPSGLLAQQDTLSHKPSSQAPGPVPWMDGIHHADPKALTVAADAIGESELLLFDLRQMQALMRLADLLLPARHGYPGANAAGTPDFLDFLLNPSSERRQNVYLHGLDWLNDESQRRFHTDFSATTIEQADSLVRPHLRTWMMDHPPVEPVADFINIAHEEMRIATYNSPAWTEAAQAAGRKANETGLFWMPVQPDLYNRTLPSAAPRKAASAAHSGGHA